MKCPGQDSRYWKPGSIFETKCPNCGEPVEFFKDDPTRKCGNCGNKCVNPNMDFGCAAYCKFADQCIGELPPELLAEREELMKDRIAIEMKKHLGKDFKRIGHATRVARHAEAIAGEAGGDPAVILAAAYLHDVGSHEAAQKQGTADGPDIETERLAAARKIMEKIGAKAELIEAVCDILSRLHHPEKEDPLNVKVVRDANRIAALEEDNKGAKADPERIKKIIETEFFTESGKDRAEKQLF